MILDTGAGATPWYQGMPGMLHLWVTTTESDVLTSVRLVDRLQRWASEDAALACTVQETADLLTWIDKVAPGDVLVVLTKAN